MGKEDHCMYVTMVARLWRKLIDAFDVNGLLNSV